MRKVFIATIVAMFSSFVFPNQNKTLSELVSFIATNDYRHCFSLTNKLDSLICSTTDKTERATYKLMKASILLNHAENVSSTDSFIIATNLCCEIESELSNHLAWQRIAALSKFANAMIGDGHPEIAFTSSTNLLNSFHTGQFIEVDTNIWDVLFRPGGLELMHPREFIRANAAALQFIIDPNVDISIYTNGLPKIIVKEIIGK